MAQDSIKNLQKVLGKLDKLENVDLTKPTEQALNHLWRVLAKSPRKSKGAFSATATPGQRRAYWARVSAGDIDHVDGVGYKRTGTLNRRWLKRVVNRGRTGLLLNRTPYGPFVQGEFQQPFHKRSKWRTVDKVVAEELDEIVEIYRGHLRRITNA